jgi:hypothetical protein
MHPKSCLYRQQRARFLLHPTRNVGADAGAVVTQRCPFMIYEYNPCHRCPAAFTDFTTPINISVERWGRGAVSSSCVLSGRVLCVRCKRICSLQEEHPAPAPLSPDQVTGVQQEGMVFRRVHFAGLSRRSACQSLLYTSNFQQAFILTGTPPSSLLIPSILVHPLLAHVLRISRP